MVFNKLLNVYQVPKTKVWEKVERSLNWLASSLTILYWMIYDYKIDQNYVDKDDANIAKTIYRYLVWWKNIIIARLLSLNYLRLSLLENIALLINNPILSQHRSDEKIKHYNLLTHKPRNIRKIILIYLEPSWI